MYIVANKQRNGVHMNCSIYGCERKVMYKAQSICQMHYFRFMRNGKYDLLIASEKKKGAANSGRKRAQNAKGYQMLYEPLHPLAMKTGYVYEHRKVIYEKFGNILPDCELCNKPISWETAHIDHKNNDVTDNDLENLRPLCRACNTFRGHSHTSMTKNIIFINGVGKSAHAWSRVEGVNVSGITIKRRLRQGFTPYEAAYGEKSTHLNSRPSKAQKRTDISAKD